MKMKNKLGLSADFFEEPDVDKWNTALKAGFTEVELGPSWQLARDMRKYHEAMEEQYSMIVKSGMNPSSFHLPFGDFIDISGLEDLSTDKALADNQGILDWVGKKKIPMAVLHASFEPIEDEERPARLGRAAESIRLLGSYAQSKNIILAIENLPRTCLGNCAGELLMLTDHGKNASICFDVNHLLKKSESHRDFFVKTAPYIVTTHFSDYDRLDERHWIPGDGCIDWKELTGLFTGAGYKGRFVFEISENSSPKLGRPFTPRELLARFQKTAG
jgi:sugar phosphate isomerase/epimerase